MLSFITGHFFTRDDSMKSGDGKSCRDREHDIRNHGIIGDTFSVALVTGRGTIDWCSFPRMDSPPVFASLLDSGKGGEFRLELAGASNFSQRYRSNTNVLRTSMKSAECSIYIDDFMPVEDVGGIPYSRHEIHRIIVCTSGEGEVEIVLQPGFNFGRAGCSIRSEKFGCVASGGREQMSLSAPVKLRVSGGKATGLIRVKKGEVIPVVLRWNEGKTQRAKMEYSGVMLKDTIAYWRKWAAKTKYDGLWKEQVKRSALVLKLLTYSPSGAICAAATTSLPESIGHDRNWDYRFSWIRDSTYALISFNALGHTEEEKKYFLWLLHLLRGNLSRPDMLRVMYTVEGDTVPRERTVGRLSGYRDSRPVREGNSATDQLQLDIYGSVVDAVYMTFRPPEKLPDMMWRIVDSIADYVVSNWKRKDMGIWEMRNGVDRHTHSALLSWVALSRTSEMAAWQGYRGREKRYARVAEEVRKTVLEGAYSSSLHSYSSSIGGGYLDASVLLMPLLGIVDARDPRFLSTLDAVRKHLLKSGFIYRYRGKDGLAGREGAFLICTFWFIAAMAKAGMAEEAKALFEHVLGHSNHLGLFSEEIDPASGEFLGNFPQAFSHMGLIDAARILSEELGAKKGEN